MTLLPTFYTLLVQETKVHFAEPLPGRQLSAAQKTPSRILSGLNPPAGRVENEQASSVRRRKLWGFHWPQCRCHQWLAGLSCSSLSHCPGWFEQPLLHGITHTPAVPVWSTETTPNSPQEHLQVTTVSLTTLAFLFQGKKPSDLPKEIQSILHSGLVLVLSQRSLFTSRHKLGCSLKAALLLPFPPLAFLSLARRRFLAPVSQHAQMFYESPLVCGLQAEKYHSRKRCLVGIEACWRHWNALTDCSGLSGRCDSFHHRAVSYTLPWVRCKAQDQSRKWKFALVPHRLCSGRWGVSIPWLCGAIRPTPYTGIKSIQ